MPGTERPQPTSFEFTEREHLYDQLSHARFMELLADEQTTIHAAELSENSYGAFLFVTISRPKADKRTYLTIYGLGYHEYRERWITEVWSWYEAMETPKLQAQRLTREEVEHTLSQRQEEIRPYLNQHAQSKRGLLYEILAEFTDEDGAISELEDLGDDADWLLGDEDE